MHLIESTRMATNLGVEKNPPFVRKKNEKIDGEYPKQLPMIAAW
jgi:predicted DsbA family dithiol-disulfide isomerase